MPRAQLPTANKATPTLQCFKPGTHLAMNGAQLLFAESDLLATAAAYDPALHEAPLVVGHPQTDGPAYGWVSKLAFADGALEALPTQVDPAFAELVNAGAYKKMSAAFWSPHAPGNPVPGVYYLRHVGFLGAAAPAVKGLRTPAFAGGDAGVLEFSEWDDTTNASLWRSLRDWLIGKHGIAEADKATPSYLVGGLEAGAAEELARSRMADEAGQAAQASVDTSTSSTRPAVFAQPNQEPLVTADQKAALEAENATLKQQLADSAAANRTARLAAANAEAVAFADGLVAQGRWPQGRVSLVVAVMNTIAAQAETAGAAVQFAQADNVQAPLLPALRQALGELPVLTPAGGGAVATAARAAGALDAGVAFAAPANCAVDVDRLALHQRALQHMSAHPGASYVDALRSLR